jgi:penicillin-binding protein 1C
MLQILRAFQLEIFHSKKEILEAYLNLAPYGGNIEGAGAASLVYFGKDVNDLTLQEALTLCVIPKNPSARNLAKRGRDAEPPEAAQAREKLFLVWVKTHPQDMEKKPLVSAPMAPGFTPRLPFLAPHFADSVLADYPSAISAKTTLDADLQFVVQRKLSSYIRRKSDCGIKNGSVMVVDAANMEVVALAGSADYFNSAIAGQVNGTRALRSPGSALKPFIYALALDEGLIHPMTMLKDAPFAYGGFNPENFDGDFHGPVHAAQALVKSRNVPAVQLSSLLKNPSLYSFLKKSGVAPLREESYYGLALALGGAEISMEKMSELYAMLANGGVLRPLRKLLGEKNSAATRMLSPEAAYITLDMLKDNPPPAQSFRREWTAGGSVVRWKTGTSCGFRDAWAMGITGHYVVAVWVGNFDGRGNPAFVGAEAAAPLMFEIADALRGAQSDMREIQITGLKNLTTVRVCAVSGQMPGPDCPVTTETLFIAGKSPIKKCDIHRRVAINPETGLAACPRRPGAVYRAYEFWPSDLLKIFRLAGIPRRVPPPPDTDCAVSGVSAGKPPDITSPQAGLVYNVGAAQNPKERIALSAVTDAGAKTLYWFMDAEYVGAAEPGQPVMWKPRPGVFTVRAVDDTGRAASRKLLVEITR